MNVKLNRLLSLFFNASPGPMFGNQSKYRVQTGKKHHSTSLKASRMQKMFTKWQNVKKPINGSSIQKLLGWPGGAVIKFARSASQRPGVCWFGSRVWTWHRLAHHAVVGVPHIKKRKMGTNVSSGLIFQKKKVWL